MRECECWEDGKKRYSPLRAIDYYHNIDTNYVHGTQYIDCGACAECQAYDEHLSHVLKHGVNNLENWPIPFCKGECRKLHGKNPSAGPQDRKCSDEYVPDGLGKHSPGAKCDAGKVELSYLEYFPRALRAVCLVSMFGAKKYSRGGWIHVKDGKRRYGDAHLRHMLPDDGFADGESGLPHAAHAAWNALAVLELELSETHGLLESMQSTVAEGKKK